MSKHINPIEASDFFSLLNNKPAIDSAPLRDLEARLAKIESDAVQAMLSAPMPLALPSPSYFPVPDRCCLPDGSLRDLMPNPIEFWHSLEPIYGNVN